MKFYTFNKSFISMSAYKILSRTKRQGVSLNVLDARADF